MIHHDSRGYEAAVNEAGDKMQAIIDKGRASAEVVIRDVLARTIQDRVVSTSMARLGLNDKGHLSLRLGGDGAWERIHPHAYGQILQDAGFPKRFGDHILEESGEADWGAELIAHNVNSIMSHRTGQRNLVRASGDEVKGWLSDKFRRLDSRPLLDAFIQACTEEGLVPIQGVNCDTKCRLRAVIPQVFRPVKDELILFGAEWGNSDYGDGGHVVNLWMMRMWCTNLAISDKLLRQVHLGKRLDDNVTYSQRTYELDTKTNASALGDMVKEAVSANRINGMTRAIQAASEQAVKGHDGVEAILKKHLEKPEIDRVNMLFESPDVVNMPEGQNIWRLSNALSWLAQMPGTSPDRTLELQTLAGNLVPTPNAKVKAEEV